MLLFVMVKGTENRHVMFVREFAAAVSLYQDKVNNLLIIWEEINSEVDELKICGFVKERLTETMDKIQRNVDKLNLEAYSNLDSWCASLDERIEEVLIARLDVAVKVCRWV
jgi:dynein heavy chain 1